VSWVRAFYVPATKQPGAMKIWFFYKFML
jgi:hypothetical protein